LPSAGPAHGGVRQLWHDDQRHAAPGLQHAGARSATGTVTIEPLQNFPIERDLVVTVGDFVKKIESIYPYIMPKLPKSWRRGLISRRPPDGRL